MDKAFTIKTLVGHGTRVAIPLLAWLLAKWGMNAAEAHGVAMEIAPDAVALVAGLVGFMVSSLWSLKGRKKLLDQEPPAK